MVNGMAQKNKTLALDLIQKKIDNVSFYSYAEIGKITGYHEKYILKLKRQLLLGTIHLEHGNKNKKPANALSEEEEEKIISLYKRSKVSIRKFCKFYGTRSYSCIYNVLKKHDLI